MDQQTSDRIVAVAVATVLVGGGVLTWQAIQQRQTSHGMMGSMMDGSSPMGGTDPIVYAVGTVLAVALLVGFYAIVRSAAGRASDASVAGTRTDVTGRPSAGTGESTAVENATSETGDATRAPDSEGESDGTAQQTIGARSEQDGPDDGLTDGDGTPTSRVLELLPDDERRILEPVVESPGITQIALRDRSNFSKSKVSQTVSELEKRGLLYREKQGRTYRVYPGDDLADRHED
ncbi:putative transcriptional regulator [Halapricum desulfuricans]|uniref:Putative transcriptional regulator n=1 Tax=Halapricum desulfuricans TaxID=2841257 RepID=A0A897NLI1_9EURY|nr:MarR family transcriptional regulator [Halapricum desulfuricans]QSG11739.1 putative transcriptional regulator [Halapricum desulfuricans]